MTRRKGETTGRINERDYPYLVELALPSSGFRDASLDIDAFHRERDLQPRHGRGRVQEGQWFVRYCFANPAIADEFKNKFGGQVLIAARRPKE